MIRAYALTASAITLRLILPAGLALGLSFRQAYILAAWGCWIVNLALAELVILRRPAGTVVPRPA